MLGQMLGQNIWSVLGQNVCQILDQILGQMLGPFVRAFAGSEWGVHELQFWIVPRSVTTIFWSLELCFPDSINASSIENHICMKFLLKQCKEESSCTDHHCPMPYQWVYMADTKWHMFNESQNINLERFFCDENLKDNQLVYLSLKCSSFSESDATSPRW